MICECLLSLDKSRIVLRDAHVFGDHRQRLFGARSVDVNCLAGRAQHIENDFGICVAVLARADHRKSRKRKVQGGEIEDFSKSHARCHMGRRSGEHARWKPSLNERAQYFGGSSGGEQSDVLVRHPAEFAQKEKRGEIGVSTDRAGGEGFSLEIADLLDLLTRMHGEIEPREDRAENRHVCTLSGGSDRGRAADLGDIDRTSEHRLNRSGARHVNQFSVETVFVEQFEVMSNPEWRVGIREGAVCQMDSFLRRGRRENATEKKRSDQNDRNECYGMNFCRHRKQRHTAKAIFSSSCFALMSNGKIETRADQGRSRKYLKSQRSSRSRIGYRGVFSSPPNVFNRWVYHRTFACGEPGRITAKSIRE